VDFWPLPEGYCFTSDTTLTQTCLLPPSPFTLRRSKPTAKVLFPEICPSPRQTP